MINMMLPMNRIQARWDFIRYAAEIEDEFDNVERGIIIEKDEEEYENTIKCFIREYPLFRNVK